MKKCWKVYLRQDKWLKSEGNSTVLPSKFGTETNDLVQKLAVVN